MSNWFNEQGAMNDSNQFTGCHKCKIKEAEKIVTENGAEGIKLRVAMLDRLNAEGEPKEITLETVWLADKNGKKPEADRMSALFLICGADPKKTKKYKVERYNFESQQKEIEAVPMYEGLMGKVVGLFIQLKKVFPNKKIDPESGVVVNFSDKGVWIPNYSKERRLSFVFLRAFFADSQKTYSEHKSNNPAKHWLELTDRYHDYEEKEMDYNSLNKLIKDRAEREGLTFNESSFSYGNIDYDRDDGTADIPANTGDEEIPF
jgi:hypothetical protein